MITLQTFERYEQKYLMNVKQYGQLKALLSYYMIPDAHGKSTIHNLYYDTDQHQLIRQSMAKPIYKEKLRVRCYGKVNHDMTVYVELKKKYEGIVYKRRLQKLWQEVPQFLEAQPEVLTRGLSQIESEMVYFVRFYKSLSPAMYIGYDREAFYGILDESFRLTFDQNIVSRTYDLDLTKGHYGDRVLSAEWVLLEVKTSVGLPLWLSHFLAENEIFKTSFSKYGVAFEQITRLGGVEHVA